jgi:hypothetical protein
MSTPTLTQSEIFATIKPEYSNHAIAFGLASGLLTPDDAGLIREFIAEKRASVGICTGCLPDQTREIPAYHNHGFMRL